MVTIQEAYEIIEDRNRLIALEEAMQIIWEYLDLDNKLQEKQNNVDIKSKKIIEDLKEINPQNKNIDKKIHDLS